jgi:hypothetical protein
VTSEREVVLDAHDVLLVVVIVVSQRFQDAYLNAALLVQLLPIFQNL